jgi:hypothetical protein
MQLGFIFSIEQSWITILIEQSSIFYYTGARAKGPLPLPPSPLCTECSMLTAGWAQGVHITNPPNPKTYVNKYNIDLLTIPSYAYVHHNSFALALFLSCDIVYVTLLHCGQGPLQYGSCHQLGYHKNMRILCREKNSLNQLCLTLSECGNFTCMPIGVRLKCRSGCGTEYRIQYGTDGDRIRNGYGDKMRNGMDMGILPWLESCG